MRLGERSSFAVTECGVELVDSAEELPADEGPAEAGAQGSLDRLGGGLGPMRG